MTWQRLCAAWHRAGSPGWEAADVMLRLLQAMPPVVRVRAALAGAAESDGGVALAVVAALCSAAAEGEVQTGVLQRV